MANGFLQQLGQELPQAGNVLLGLSAGLQGRGPQFAQQQQALQLAQQEQQRKAEIERRKTLFTDASSALKFAKQGRFDLVTQLGQSRIEFAQQFPGTDFSDTERIMQLSQLASQGDKEAAERLIKELDNTEQIGIGLGVLQGPGKPKQQIVGGQLVTIGPGGAVATDIEGLRRDGGADKGTEQVFFESLLESLPDDGTKAQKQQNAREVKLGLRGRKVSNAILSAIASGDIKNLADAKAQIRQAEKFGEMTGSSRAKAIDAGVEKIVKIDAGIKNIDRAIEAVQGGAGVGAIQKNFPSIRAASVELDNIQKSMALDVIGAVTFGALSKGELDLAREVALPTGLDSPQLIDHLQQKKAAQQKLRAYYNDQIQHLDQGGTVASFIRLKEREGAAGQNQAIQPAAPTQNRNIQVDF